MTCRVTADSILPPDLVTGLQSTALGNGIALDWDDEPASQRVSEYSVYRSTNRGGPFSLLDTTVISSYTDLTATASILYWYRITATNTGGESDYTDISGEYFPDTTPPGVPIITATTQVGTNAVEIDWTAPTNADLGGYNVYRSTSSGGTFTKLNTAGLVTSATFTDLSATAGSHWYYRVTSVDVTGNESAAATTDFAVPASDTTPPAVPIGLIAVNNKTFILINWSANHDVDFASYSIFRSDDGYTTALATGLTSATYQDTTAVIGTSYQYKVIAVDTNSNSSAKSIASNSVIRTASITIVVNPGAVDLLQNTKQQFVATVSGSSNQAVTWTCNHGSITSTGLFTAPNVIEAVTITATSQLDNVTFSTATANVVLTLPGQTVTIMISPITVSVAPGGTQQFLAQVTGTTNIGVTWTCSAGTISSSGLFQAPATSGNVTVTATSNADPTQKSTSTVTVTSSGGTGGGGGGTITGTLANFLKAGTMVPCAIHARGVNFSQYRETDDATNKRGNVTFTETADFPTIASGTMLTTRYEWDFAAGSGNTRGSYSQGRGFNYAHAYDQAGTYTVQLTRTDQNGKVEVYSSNVTLVADTRTVVYCSSNGDGSSSNGGTDKTKPVNLSRAAAILNANSDYKVLLRQGDTFNISGNIFTLNLTRQMISSNSSWTTGSGGLPVINFSTANTTSSSRSFIQINSGASNTVVENFAMNRTYSGGNPTNDIGVNTVGHVNVLIRGITFTKIGKPLEVDQSTATTRYLLCQDCSCPNTDSLQFNFLFCKGADFVFFGILIANSVNEHCIRISQCDRILIAHCNLTNRQFDGTSDIVKTTTNFQQGSYCYIAKNTLTCSANSSDPFPGTGIAGTCQIGPLNQGTATLEAFCKYCVFEDNLCVQASVQVTDGAQSVMIRNNYILKSGGYAIEILGKGNGNDQYGRPLSTRVNTNVYVFNNTLEDEENQPMLWLHSTMDTFQCINNLFIATKYKGSDVMLQLPTLGNNNFVQRNVFPTWDKIMYSSSTQSTATFNKNPGAGNNIVDAVTVDSSGKPTFGKPATGTEALPVLGVFSSINGIDRLQSASSWTPGCYEVSANTINKASDIVWSGTHTNLLQPGSYAITAHTIPAGSNITIQAADPANPPTLTFPSVWGAAITGPDSGVPTSEGTINVLGTFTLNNVKTTGGANVILLTSSPGAVVNASDITMDGGGFGRFAGADSISMKRIQSTGSPHAYFLALFVAQVNTLTWDNTGVSGHIKQGGYTIADGDTQGEACIRFMWGQSITMTNVIVDKFIDPLTSSEYKQSLQDRAGGDVGDNTSVHTWINCTTNGTMEVDWMGGTRPPGEIRRPLHKLVMTNCSLHAEPTSHYRSAAPWAECDYTTCLFNGVSTTKTVAGHS